MPNELIIRIDPAHFDAALRHGPGIYGADDASLAIDGKTMRHAVDAAGRQTHRLRVVGHDRHVGHPKKGGTRPVGGDDTVQQAHEIGRVIPLLTGRELAGKTLTAEAPLTPRRLAASRVNDRQAYDILTVKDHQSTLLADIHLTVTERGTPDVSDEPNLAQGRIEQRAIWTSTLLKDDRAFSGVGQVFGLERHTRHKRTGQETVEVVYGITRHTPTTVGPAQLLALKRGHWDIENGCH